MMKNEVEKYFNQYAKKFYSDEIESLPKKWEEVVETKNDYISS